MLTVAVPGLCQLPDFKVQAEPITQIVCHYVPAQAAEDANPALKSQTQNQDQHHTDSEVEDPSMREDESDAHTNLTAQ